MNLLDWAALVGALAWVPVIVEWVIRAIRKTKLSIITAKDPEIGYSILGCILNYRIAITAENGPVVITKMQIILTHESGERRTLTWQGTVQTYGSMTIEDKKMPMEKDQVALAIKVNDSDVDERFYRFQEEAYNTERQKLFVKSVERLGIIIDKKGEGNHGEELLASDEVHKMKEHFVHGMFWKSGKYAAEIRISALSKTKLVSGNKFNFVLTPLDIQQLNYNKQQFDGYIKNQVYGSTIGYEQTKLSWNWQYPIVTIN